MTTNEIITMIVQAVCVPLLIYGLTIARNYLKTKIKTAQVLAILDQATDAATKATAKVAQTYVDSIKGTADWDIEAQYKALSLARDEAMAMLGESGIRLLETATGSANAYLTAAIEEAVRGQKE